MKWIKIFEDFEDIDGICKKYGIQDYTINSEGKVDVDGDVDFGNHQLYNIPLKFGKVYGGFYCGNNKLTSLEGCPSLWEEHSIVMRMN